MTTRFATPWAHFECIYQWTSLYKREQKDLANLRELTNCVSIIFSGEGKR